jgi:peptidoglycan/xylan/chitin deacetylase (PgdA/CDA1 family)
MVDDNDVDYAEGVAEILDAHGGKMTWFVTKVHFEEAELPRVQALAAAGHEVALHAWSHGRADITLGLTITSTNTSPTVDVDVPTSELRLRCVESENHVTVSWASGDKTIDDLTTAAAGKGWTISLHSVYIQSRAKLASFADTGGPVAVPHDLALDVTAPDYAWFREEYADANDWIAALTGDRPTTSAWPNNGSTVAAREYLRDSVAILGARGGSVSGNATQMLDSIALYDVTAVTGPRIAADGTEAGVRAATRAAYNQCVQSQYGCLFDIYSHREEEMPLQHWEWMVDEVVQAGGAWVTFAEAINWARANMVTTDGLVYTR